MVTHQCDVKEQRLLVAEIDHIAGRRVQACHLVVNPIKVGRGGVGALAIPGLNRAGVGLAKVEASNVGEHVQALTRWEHEEEIVDALVVELNV